MRREATQVTALPESPQLQAAGPKKAGMGQRWMTESLNEVSGLDSSPDGYPHFTLVHGFSI